MLLDAYAICPCGSGKKLKFCCCKDLVHELDKVVRAINGDQRVAALDLINRLIADHGKRAALLTLKAECLLAIGNIEETEKVAKDLLEAMPHGAIGLAIDAILQTYKGEVDPAVERLQEALEVTDGPIFPLVLGTVGLVGQSLLMAGKIYAARGHFMMQASFLQKEEQNPGLESLGKIDASPHVPLPYKENFEFAECPPGVRWQGEFNAAMKSARRGAWLAACESLESLDQKVANQPAVWRNIAIMRTWLGQIEEAVSAWRKYAELPGLPLDEVIEAELVALNLSASLGGDDVDVVQLSYGIPDVDRCMEFLLSDKRAESFHRDPEDLEEGEPPPKGSFFILDRPMPASLDSIQSASDLPFVLAELDVYGKQTDREARVEIRLDRTRAFEARRSDIEQWLGDRMGARQSETVVDTKPRLMAEIGATARMPPSGDAARRQELVKQHGEEVMLKQWRDLPSSYLDGKSPREAAAIPQLRNRVSAMILQLEVGSGAAADLGFNYNELRKGLGLPERGVAKIPEEGTWRMSFLSLGSVDFAKLSDENLLVAFQRLASVQYRIALIQCATEVLKRDSLATQVNFARVYRLLATVSLDSDKALEYLDKGRRLSASQGESLADWYLLELQIRIVRGELEEANRVINVTLSRYGKEPNVQQHLVQILARFGLINPDGTMAGPPRGAQPAGPVNAPEPAAAPALWTPDSPTPAAPKQESKLWLPGT